MAHQLKELGVNVLDAEYCRNPDHTFHDQQKIEMNDNEFCTGVPDSKGGLLVDKNSVCSGDSG